MSIRRRIIFPMLALAIGSCAAVLLSSIMLFSKEMSDAMHDKVDVAGMVVENEIKNMISGAEVAAFAMANNPVLIDALLSNNRDEIAATADALKTLSNIDYCTILDSKGNVLTRTHEPNIYGDNLAKLPHVKQAMAGNSKAYVTQGVTIRLGTYAGAPIYDNHKKLIGIVSVGFRLDEQDFAYKLKELTGCEISVFSEDVRVATTLFVGDDLTYAVGTRAPGHISQTVMGGDHFVGKMRLFDRDMLIRHAPVRGAEDKVVGMTFVGFFTEDYTNKMMLFVMYGTLITLAVLAICLIIARSIAGVVERKLTSITDLVAAKEAAEQNSRYKSAFLATMSHEIRTPMNAILGIAEIQLRDEKLTPNTEEAFGRIYESGDLLLNIINDVLDLSKIEAGKLELNPAKYDIPSLINDTVQLNRLRYESKPLQFITQVDENTPLDMFGDELRIKQILNNILSNAFKYTNEGAIEFSVTCEKEPGSETQIDDVKVIFRVSDTGQGMTEEQIEKLFNEYTRFNSGANRTTIGAGLGMSITKRLVDMMQGDISVKSEEGKGTVFTVSIPQKRIGETVCGAELVERLRYSRFHSTSVVKKTQFLREFMPYGYVLVVDDVESNLHVARGMMKPYGMKLETVSSGFAAIEKVKSGNVYDIIFMDHMMPKMDGMEATKIIREMGYTHSIIALTANALTGQKETYLRNGFDDFIAKPLDSRELNLMLNDYIRNRKPPEVVEAARREKRENDGGMADETQDAERMAELRAFFVRDAENAINILKTLSPKIQKLDKGELDTYITTVHGMKSALANIGEKKLSNAAFKLELAGKEKNINVITGETQKFLDTLCDTVIKYKPAEEEHTTDITDSDGAYLREKLKDFKAACAGFDITAANTALNALKQKTWPIRISNTLNEVAVHLLHSEFDEAGEKAGNL